MVSSLGSRTLQPLAVNRGSFGPNYHGLSQVRHSKVSTQRISLSVSGSLGLWIG